MLEAKDIGFRYGRRYRWLFRGLNFRLGPGERVGLLGPSGQGKSTFAKILAGYLQPQEGQVIVDGQTLQGRGFCPVQLLFQHPELAVNPRWTIRQILAEASMPMPALRERLGVAEAWFERFPHELSGGELQRVCLARAMDNRTQYLICDEMTSMLDALTQAHIWHVVLEIVLQRNLGILVISHDPDLLARVCQRMYALR